MKNNNGMVLPLSFAAPIAYYSALLKNESFIFSSSDYFKKQTFRNRYFICNSNGKHLLTIPVKKFLQNTPFSEIEISYQENWQQNHIRSIESAYRKSPYFEYFWDELLPVYQNKYVTLIESCEISNKLFNRVIGISKHEISSEEICTTDFENSQGFSKEYYQVFSQKLAFVSNLSILDLIMNEGKNAIKYI
jgi:hypothetical protein